MEVRINKYLASFGIAARRKVDLMIEGGKVSVNGKKAELGMKIDPQKDQIEVGGKKVGEDREKIYIALNKPKEVVSTVSDTHGRRTVVELVDVGERLFPVGRLDQDSEGLMLLTNDGNTAFLMTHPKFHIEKTYEVWVKGAVGADKLGRLEGGVRLDDGTTAKVRVRVVRETAHNSLLEMVLSQGKNRQIRRMCAALHLHITSLKRIKMGPVELGDLKVGKWRYLNPKEIEEIRSL